MPGKRWCKYPSLISRIAPDGALLPRPRAPRSGIEDYERTLSPALIGYYRAHGYCWVVSGSTQSGRAFADPRAVPRAVAYYRALARRGEVVYRASPYARGQRPRRRSTSTGASTTTRSPTSRPGPQMTVYRLHGGRCG